MVNPKHRLPQSFFGITADESHHSLQLPKSVFYKFSFVRAAPFFILHFSFFILHLKSCPKLPPCMISASNFFPSTSLGSHIIQGTQLFFDNYSQAHQAEASVCPFSFNCCSPNSSACGHLCPSVGIFLFCSRYLYWCVYHKPLFNPLNLLFNSLTLSNSSSNDNLLP